MSDHLRVVEDIRAFLSATDQTRTLELAELASTYAGMCKEANERLRRCIDLLRRGLRTEAIHQAEAMPELLEVVGILDFAEVAEWENTCAAYEMPRPPRIAIEAAQELNEAYGAEQPLQTVLARHRLVNLGRAPMAHRVQVLRSLADSEPGNQIWEEDLQVFEGIRINEMRTEATNANKAGDEATIRRIQAELKNGRWRTPVPRDVMSFVDTTSHKMDVQWAVKRLHEMLPQLESAYSAMAFDECGTLQEQWQQIIQSVGMNLPADLAEKVQPIFDWVAQERDRRALDQQYNEACGRFAAAIASNASNEELNRQHSVLAAWDRKIPDELVRGYHQKLEERELAERRRLRRNWAMTTAAMLLVAGLVGFGIFRAVRSSHSKRWAQEISNFTTAGDLGSAEARWKALLQESPGLSGYGALVEARDKLDKALAAEAQRIAQRSTAMQEAVAMGLAHPDRAALDRATLLCKTPTERLALMELKEKIEDAIHEATRASDAAFEEQVTLLSQAVRGFDAQLLATNIDAYGKRLEELEASYRNLDATPNVSATAKAGLVPIGARLGQLRADYKAEKDRRHAASMEAEETAAVITSLISAQKSAAAIKAFADKYPASPRGRSFQLALDRAADWAAVESWNNLVAGWEQKLHPSSPQDIAMRLEAVAKYLSANPDGLLKSAVKRYETYLSRAQQALDKDGPWKTDLRKLTESPLMANVKMIRTTDGKTYYMLGDGNMRTGTIGLTFDVLTSNDVTQKRTVTLRQTNLVGQAALSPQSKLAGDIEGMLRGFKPQDWDTFGFDVVQQTIDMRDMDPVLRTILLQRILRHVATTSWQADSSIQEALTTLAETKAEEAAWMNPDDPDAPAARKRCQRALSQLPDSRKLRDGVVAKRNEMFQLLGRPHQGLGILVKNSGGLEVMTTVQPKDGQEACILSSPDAKGELTQIYRPIGTAESGRFKLEAGKVGGVPEGSLIFIVDKTK